MAPLLLALSKQGDLYQVWFSLCPCWSFPNSHLLRVYIFGALYFFSVNTCCCPLINRGQALLFDGSMRCAVLRFGCLVLFVWALLSAVLIVFFSLYPCIFHTPVASFLCILDLRRVFFYATAHLLVLCHPLSLGLRASVFPCFLCLRTLGFVCRFLQRGYICGTALG